MAPAVQHVSDHPPVRPAAPAATEGFRHLPGLLDAAAQAALLARGAGRGRHRRLVPADHAALGPADVGRDVQSRDRWAGSRTGRAIATSRTIPTPAGPGRRCRSRCWSCGAPSPATRTRPRPASSIATGRRPRWASTRTATRPISRPRSSRSRSATMPCSASAARPAGSDPPLVLRSGDVVVLGGAARLCFHGIDRVLPAVLAARAGRRPHQPHAAPGDAAPLNGRPRPSSSQNAIAMLTRFQAMPLRKAAR